MSRTGAAYMRRSARIAACVVLAWDVIAKGRCEAQAGQAACLFAQRGSVRLARDARAIGSLLCRRLASNGGRADGERITTDHHPESTPSTRGSSSTLVVTAMHVGLRRDQPTALFLCLSCTEVLAPLNDFSAHRQGPLRCDASS